MKIMQNYAEKYIKRLKDANLDGFRCCIVDCSDESEIRKYFREEDGYYFTRDSENRLWLNWE